MVLVSPCLMDGVFAFVQGFLMGCKRLTPSKILVHSQGNLKCLGKPVCSVESSGLVSAAHMAHGNQADRKEVLPWCHQHGYRVGCASASNKAGAPFPLGIWSL